MKFALCAIALFAVTPCSAQQSDLLPSQPRYRITESSTISVEELQQRTESKAKGIFADAKAAARQRDHARAVKLFQKVLKIDPAFADARNDLAVELIVCGEIDQAKDELARLTQMDPHFLMAYTNLGAILCEQKNYSEAERVLRRAVNLAPTSAKVNLLLAVALYQQGKRGSETRNAIEFAAKSNPVAGRLVKEWYSNSDLADKGEPHDIPAPGNALK